VNDEYHVTDYRGEDGNTKSNFDRTFTFGDLTASAVEKPVASRYSNTSPARIEIRYGKDNSVFRLVEIQVDYVKSPQYIRLTQE